MDHAFEWVIQNGGIDTCTDKDYKYHAVQCRAREASCRHC